MPSPWSFCFRSSGFVKKSPMFYWLYHRLNRCAIPFQVVLNVYVEVLGGFYVFKCMYMESIGSIEFEHGVPMLIRRQGLIEAQLDHLVVDCLMAHSVISKETCA